MHIYLTDMFTTFYHCEGNLYMYVVIKTFGCTETYIGIRSFNNLPSLLYELYIYVVVSDFHSFPLVLTKI